MSGLTQSELIKAIDNHLQVQFCYHNKLRMFEPYMIIEKTDKNFLKKIHVWGLLRNDPTPPHYFEIKNISRLSISTVRFVPDQNFSIDKFKMDGVKFIHCIDVAKIFK